MPAANHFKVKVKKDKISKIKKPKVKSAEEDTDFQTWNLMDEKCDQNGTFKLKVNETLSDKEEKGAFHNFPLNDHITTKLKARGIEKLFPVQYLSFNAIFEGRDVIVQARTGTGKTFAFALPIIEKLMSDDAHKSVRGRTPRALILAPTRELANQIANDFNDVAPGCLSILPVYGGTGYDKQTQKLNEGVDIVVGTPGRIMDHMKCENLVISKVQFVVLDEVDEMLDMGFRDDVDNIIKELYSNDRVDTIKKEIANESDIKRTPQTLLFSATLPIWVHETAKKYLDKDVFHLSLIDDKSVRTSTKVKHMAIKCHWKDRAQSIGSVIRFYSCGPDSRSIVFCERKSDADELAGHMAIPDAHVLHGDIKQETRESILQKFRDGKYRVLVTTNVAARGLDIPDIDLVIQCHPPKNVEQYIHRSGRTGRAERSGISICFYTMKEHEALRAVEVSAGIQFERTHVPSEMEIAKVQQTVVFNALKDIPESAWQLFSDSAQTLIDELGAERAVAAALAKISRTTDEVVPRSLITCAEGYTSYLLKTTNSEVRNKGYAYASLRRHLPDTIAESIRGLQFLKDKTGFVFDIPSSSDSIIEDRWQDGRYDSLSKLDKIPELEQVEDSRSSFPSKGRGGSRGRGGGGFSRGGHQNFRDRNGSERGGRGRGSFGRGRGGGFRGSNRGNNHQSNGFSLNRNGAIKRSNPSSTSDNQSKRIKFD